MKSNPVYDIMLSYFCSIDDMRPQFKTPSLNQENDHVYATDAHIMIKVPAKILRKRYKTNEKFPAAENIFNQYDFSETGKINTESLLNAVAEFNLHRGYEYIKCDKCGGSGVLECEHCNSEYDCNDCKGTGNKGKNQLPLKVLICEDSNNSRIMIGNHYFNVEYIQILAVFAKMLTIDEIDVTYTIRPQTSPMVFKFGEATVLYMPQNISHEDETVKIKCISIN